MNEIKRPQTVAIHLKHYFWLSYVLVLVNIFSYVRQVQSQDALTVAFSLSVFLFYGFVYLGAAFIPVIILERVVSLRMINALLIKLHIRSEYVIYILAVALCSSLQIFIYTDKFIYQLYDFHINGFVWNLITTEGGLESLGSSSSTVGTFVLIALGIVATQTILLIAVFYSPRLNIAIKLLFGKKWRRFALAALLILAGCFQLVVYGVCEIEGHSPVLVASSSFPFYCPVTFKHLAQRMGYEVNDKNLFKIKANTKSIRLNYPLQPIQLDGKALKYNIVWLVAESWRADMLDPEIMPFSWSFSRESVKFTDHYSGGNGTRMGLFSMFYGLYGNYWFPFLAEQRSPVLMDILQANNYQMKMFTSAKFTYPEFDRTIFARIPSESLVECEKGLSGWEYDRKNVTKLLDFVAKRDCSRPFMTFMFFESPHANYYFPPESIIRKEYLHDFNYVTMDLKSDIQSIKNRYINSCHHLDSQYQRIFDYLGKNGLLDSTIVIVTGDHGEEFMEKGHWGHNSAFTEEQLQVPLFIKIPGREGRTVTGMSSHVDIPAMVLSELGVVNPAKDYSLGRNRLVEASRDFTIVADWDSLCYVGHDYKMELPMKNYGLSKQRLYGPNDSAIRDEAVFMSEHQSQILSLMKNLMMEMTLFNKK